MKLLAAICIGALLLPIYSYFGYPMLLFFLGAVKQLLGDVRYMLCTGERRCRETHLPTVSIIIAAYNEEDVIENTLRKCLDLDYPADRLEIIVGSDGSNDRTVPIARRIEDERLQVLNFDQRRGKVSVISDCAEHAQGDVLVFTDANTSLRNDSVRKLVRHFQNPSVGAVCGQLRLLPAGEGQKESFYWRYEVVLKILESRLGAVLGANGAIYALRRELFPAVSRDLITEDFVIPLKLRAKGLKTVYDPEAMAYEDAAPSTGSEFRRRVRIGAGNWQALRHCASLLMPWEGFISLAFWSHKVLRWITPFSLSLALITNAFLIQIPFWRGVFVAQLGFYAAATLGWLLRKLRLPAGPLAVAEYFVGINIALAFGMLRGVLGRQRAAWNRTARETPVGE
jgi:cellulose synthase/poly-beta-1,6-N-acetylglucosamine synthase-like glycosyltransferase